MDVPFYQVGEPVIWAVNACASRLCGEEDAIVIAAAAKNAERIVFLL